MESVYLETSFISYLAARPSRDLITAGHQQLSHEWWNSRRQSFSCVASEVVMDEAAHGNAAEIEKRLSLLREVIVLRATPATEDLALRLLSTRAFPEKAIRDVAHIAIATVHRVDFLMTWNCKHLANAQIIPIMSEVCRRAGFDMPMICTPEELMGV